MNTAFVLAMVFGLTGCTVHTVATPGPYYVGESYAVAYVPPPPPAYITPAPVLVAPRAYAPIAPYPYRSYTTYYRTYPRGYVYSAPRVHSHGHYGHHGHRFFRGWHRR